MFSSSVNSPLKPNQTKEGGTNIATRKASISNTTNPGSVTRPGTRRRETSDSFTANGPLSPSESKPFFRNEPNTNTPPPALLRRRTDFKDEDKVESKEDDEDQTSFGSLKRIATGPQSAGFNGPTNSPWSTGGPRSAFDAMGNFGSFTSPTTHEVEKRPGFGSARGASRFKDLLTKSSVEDMTPSVKEKASIGALEKLPEEDNEGGQSKMKDIFKTRPTRSETNPYAETIPRGGSAALSQDEPGVEHFGFSEVHGETQSTPHGRKQHDPLSPSNTNPYTSPAVNRNEGDETESSQPGLPPFGGRRDMFAGTYQPTFGAPRQPLGGLGGIPGWGSTGFGTGTPGRERNAVSTAFGDPIFSPMGDLQSPGGLFGTTGFGSAGRSNRLGALFPPAMQDQTRSDSRNDAFDGDQMGNRDPFSSGRRQDNIRSLFEDDFRPGEAQFPTSQHVPEQSSGHGPSPSGGSTTSNTLPTTQQRQMVMPDRMRWIYRDPSGQVQGPWSGLEMHDWFKAGFFTAELQVKKLEDVEYEPLAQLVRRIGNSREPFLVPQIGVPHGPASTNPSNHWASTMGPTGTQPPFANNFPSFGTTLTAEQQNALERRKQEEQYLMARQKEHLAQQQMYMKQMHVSNPSGGNHGLQHHASAHSLQSQPSFGSITSPGGYQQSSQGPIQPPQSIHTSMMPNHPTRDDDVPGMMNMNFNQRSNPFGPSPVGQNRRTEQATHEESFLGQDGRNERLEEFHDLRKEIDEETQQRPEENISLSIDQPKSDEMLSLTQQVQRTTAANEKAASTNIEIPPVSISPLPAPTPNRNRQYVADQLAAESRSQSQTPVEPSSLAPWAQAGLPKGQSLKEIQEAEAKRAIEQEKVITAARQAQAEQDRIAATVVVVVAPAPGLPATSNWASSVSPASPGPTNVWGAKPTPKPTIVTATKKTLAQIQKEEELRKQRAAQVQVTSINAGPVGKRYAELAGKVSPVSSQPVTSSWTTVGASGKVKQTPVTVVATPQARTVSTTIVPVKPRPIVQTTRTVSVSNNKTKADDEFIKWAKSQLDDKLNPGINGMYLSSLIIV